MAGIPTYALYGEFDDRSDGDWLHCETIQARSRRHGYRIEPHRHETLFQILHLTGGRAEVSLDGQAAALEPPCAVILPPMVVHSYAFSPDVEGRVLTFFERRLQSILAAASEIGPAFREPCIIALGPHPGLARSIATNLEMLTAEFEGRAAGRLGAIEARLALVLIALHRARQPDLKTASSRSTRSLHHAMRFRELVDEDFRNRMPIDRYAQRLGLTSTHLNRICREHLGDSALGIINRRLILEAKRYLVFTSLSAKEIALALEFEDPSYFTRFFKRETGVAPLAFRALQRVDSRDLATPMQNSGAEA